MKKKLLTFIAVCYSVSLLFAGAFQLLNGNYKSVFGTIFASAYMLIPIISVLICQTIFKEKAFKNCGVSFKLNWWWLAAWLIMPVFNTLALFASALIPGVDISTKSEVIHAAIAQIPMLGPWGVYFVTILSGLIAGISINAVFAFCEEVAWRGWLPGVMKELGFWKKTLLIGFIWGLWHAPVILMGHNYPSHPVPGVFMMILFCMSLAPVLQFLREKCNSVIPAAIAHGTMNATAGLSMIYLSANNDLLCGSCGIVGICVLIIFDLIIALTKPES